MYDLEIEMANRPGALATMGQTLGEAGLSVEGGGVWVVGDKAYAHYLFEDGDGAAEVLKRAGFRILAVAPVVALRLRQDIPGQLGMLARRMADAEVNIQVQYSDHDHRLILVTEDHQKASMVAEQWMREYFPNPH